MNFINIKRNSKTSLSKQLYTHYKELILSGKLNADDKLPSTRELARMINVSRNVVLDCYEQLIAEGYVYTKNGSGTYISKGIRFEQKNIRINATEQICRDEAQTISFRTGVPDLGSIPINKWAQIYKESILNLNTKMLDYQNSFGNYELRTQLALYLERVRGVCASPNNILITNGAAQAFSLLCKMVQEREYVLVENPLSHGILHTLLSHHVMVKSIRVDESGMVTSELPNDAPKLIFTTPSHQFPTGVVLPINRRIEMIQYAQNHETFIVEDDYDSEFRFSGDPIQAMQYLDPDKVIYVGTFSKTLMPSLRIGYMVLPDKLLQTAEDIKYVADLHSPNFEQIALANFIKMGYFERHISKMRRLYLKRRNYLMQQLKRTFTDQVIITGAQAGMHLVATFKDIIFDENKINQINRAHIDISSIDKHYIKSDFDDRIENTLLFGYGNTDMEQIEKGIGLLAGILGVKP